LKPRYYPWLAPLYKRLSLARVMAWQSQFLTKFGFRYLLINLSQEEVEQITFVRQGIRWTADVRDRSVGAGLFLSDAFERANVDILLAWIRAHGRTPHRNTILEIGANIGTSTIPFLLGTNCRVVCVEPVPRSRAALQVNLQQNQLANRVIIMPCAIADESKTVDMIVPLHALGGAELLTREIKDPANLFHSPCEKISVEAIPLDELLVKEKILPDEIEFAWSDTQGSEGAVIRTGAPLWQAGVPLWVEIEPALIDRQDNLERFCADAARYFASFIPNSRLHADGVDAPPQPIATLAEFALPLYGSVTDVLLLPREN
jgi:FkbM family methyltransferase